MKLARLEMWLGDDPTMYRFIGLEFSDENMPGTFLGWSGIFPNKPRKTVLSLQFSPLGKLVKEQAME